MIHDPCIVPQLRSKKREHDDWFLLQMGCFDSDGDKGEGSGKGGASDLGDAGEAIASDFVDPYDQDEAADYADRVSASTGAGGSSIGDNETRAVNIPNIRAGGPNIDYDEESARFESPLSGFEDLTVQQARERKAGEQALEASIRDYEFSNMLDSLPNVDPDEPEGGAAAGLNAFRSDIFGDVDPFDLVPDDLPGGAVAAGTPAGAQLQAVGRQAFRGARPELGGSGAQTVNDTTVPTAQSMAGVNQSRPITDFDDVTLPTGPGVPKDTFVQDTTPRTKEEEAMAADQAYFNERDLNKDGTVGPIENLISRAAFGLVGKASDLERKANIGDPMAGMDYEGEAYGTPDSIFGESERGDNNEVSAVPDVPPGPTGCPDGYEFNSETGACEYKGVSYAGIGQSQGQGTVNLGPYTPATQYTGISGLEPFVLRPTPGTLDLTPRYRFPDTKT